MASENIKLRYENFTVHQGYFYNFDHSLDGLYQKTDDGNTAFSYPLDTLLSNEINSTEFDGVYFWTLEDSGTYDTTIRRWEIDNYVCKLRQTFNFTETGSHRYQSAAFSVEHYHTTLASGVTVSGTDIFLTKYADQDDLMSFTTTDGDPLTLHLGPNSSGQEEDVQVSTVTSGSVYTVTLVSGTNYAYDASDDVNFYTYLWLFNDRDGLNATGALYKFDAYTGEYIKKYSSGAYKSVGAATFYTVDSFIDYGDVDTLCYVKGTNLLFVNVREETDAGTLDYYGSMVMENIKSDEVTVITVYDLAMDDQNVYRLQKTPDGTGTTWSYASYLLSSLDSFVTSISLAAYPAVIAANTVSTSNITAIVKDQFLQPITSRLVNFSDDDSVGSITGPNPVNTDSDGSASTVYESGNTAREVKITAVVEQT